MKWWKWLLMNVTFTACDLFELTVTATVPEFYAEEVEQGEGDLVDFGF